MKPQCFLAIVDDDPDDLMFIQDALEAIQEFRIFQLATNLQAESKAGLE